MKKIFLLLTLTTSLLLASCSKENSKIIVLTSSGYEPYEMVDDQGNLIGFDIDLMDAIALEMGIEIEYRDVNFDGIIASLQTYKADIAIAGITPTKEREKVIDFSNVYFNELSGLENFLLFKEDQTYNNLEDLSGLTLSAQIGTVQAEILNELSSLYNFTVELRNTNTQLLEEIKSNNIDGILVESLVADSIVDSNDFIIKTKLDYVSEATLGNAIALGKNSIYKDEINKALATLNENGTITLLINKWFN
ncbi:hypothetical protein CI105_03405 [Candidatus Izimaplasma bacterium ZiA1]|uniref:transporter substrate-binding domain-containing protein n=1 Tax=Candidatus Izimoplasma sp. ZiA1 TaxID=2024899 RepID=UPI000BAA5C75|nr:hypothetical protein CI105_03405 [Candidatus Izimaplasma bacterium ZiA1]